MDLFSPRTIRISGSADGPPSRAEFRRISSNLCVRCEQKQLELEMAKEDLGIVSRMREDDRVRHEREMVELENEFGAQIRRLNEDNADEVSAVMREEGKRLQEQARRNEQEMQQLMKKHAEEIARITQFYEERLKK